MFEANPIFSVLSKALDNASLQQAVHTSNIANASTDKYSRLDVVFDNQLDAARARVVRTGEPVKLDREMASMAKDAVHYEALLGAYERSMAMLRLATHEGKE